MKVSLPSRKLNSNKYDGGRVLIIGGDKGLYGAGILGALAATKSGAGFVYLMSEISKFNWIKYPDFILLPKKIKNLKNKFDFAIGIGPGLSKVVFTEKLINYLLKNNFTNITLDAGALTIVAEKKTAPLNTLWILTPHVGEMAKLINKNINWVNKNKIKSVKMAFEIYQCHILLKGPINYLLNPKNQTIIKIKINEKSLSKAGTGDVLLGLLTSFRAQGLDPLSATTLAIKIHALCALDYLKDKNDHLSLRPLDLIDRLPKIIFDYRKSLA